MKRAAIVPAGFRPYNTTVQVKIGRRIQQCRLAQNMTPSELACAMCYETTSPISKIENGDMCLSIDRLYELSQILGVSTDYLLFGDEYSKGYKDIIESLVYLDPMELKVVTDILRLIGEKLGTGVIS